jgi:hypothetical protein
VRLSPIAVVQVAEEDVLAGLGEREMRDQRLTAIADRDIRVIDLDGQLLRQLTLDPTRTYQPLGRG